MSAKNERLAFAQRLTQAMKQNGYAPDRISAVTREFNLRFKDSNVTVHAVRKWLLGEAVPTQEKIQVLADWLGVSAHWLRFGESPASHEALSVAEESTRDLKIIAEFRKLDAVGKTIVESLILSLLKHLPQNSYTETYSSENSNHSDAASHPGARKAPY
jgi:transcriptional regulator with XRE-family HTH domain